jgi:hypothetical protein
MIDKHEAEVMAHALGLKEPGQWVEEPYRNRFHVPPGTEDDNLWHKLTNRHLAKLVAGPTESLPYNTYAVTDTGKRAVAMFGVKDALGNPIIAHVEYVIEDATASSDCALFWKPNHRGYTCDLALAGRYPGIEAAPIVANCLTSSPERQDRAWPLEYLERHAIKHVSRDVLYTAHGAAKAGV